MLEAICYRVGQFLHALTARIPVERAERAVHVLPPPARVLFFRQSAGDQRHALAVYDALCRQGYTDPHLLAAALLHDVGKAKAPLPAWQRAVIVLLERFAPELCARLGRKRARGWQKPFAIHARHAETGARWARQAGCSALTVKLIHQHHERISIETGETGERRWLAALQAADDVN